MTRPALRDLVVRAWEIGPTTTEALALAVGNAALIIFWGVSWWLTFGLTLFVCVALFGTLAWLDLDTDAADEAMRAGRDADEAD